MLEVMVTMNIQVDEELFERLRELAKKTGRTAEQAATELLASLSSGGIELDDEQEAAIAEGFAQLDRGEHVTEADVMAKVKALRR
jgi:predicted transcriptional regulator